jgi:hypothetical protein
MKQSLNKMVLYFLKLPQVINQDIIFVGANVLLDEIFQTLEKYEEIEARKIE